MLKNFNRQILESLWPRGLFWEPELNSDYDKLLDGISENSEVIYESMKELAYIRDPLRTPILSDLEKEYGVFSAESDTEEERRQFLFGWKKRGRQKATAQELQERLRDSGFTDIFVYPITSDFNFNKTLLVGDTGPAGGTIIYDKGTESDGWRYLEVGTTDLPNIEWIRDSSLQSTPIAGAIAPLDSNINNWTGEEATEAVARIGTITDWYLPSKDELDLMYNNLKLAGLGNFSNSKYWSSSDTGADGKAWSQDFSSGDQTEELKTGLFKVRASRVFIDARDLYVIGDTGPGEGIIFYVTPPALGLSTYYEASLTDIGEKIFSNVYWPVSGTNTTLESSQNNTSLIINQEMHTRSSALLCDNFESNIQANESAALTALSYAGGGFTDWFLPSRFVHEEIYNNVAFIPGGMPGIDNAYSNNSYWSSDQPMIPSGNTDAFYFNYNTGAIVQGEKFFELTVRPVRKVEDQKNIFDLIEDGDGYILAVGPHTLTQSPFYIAVAGEEVMQCGEVFAQCGQREWDLIKRGFVNDFARIPENPRYWPLMFFVGGAMSTDPLTGATTIENYVVTESQKQKIDTVVVRKKPVHSWAIMRLSVS